VGAFSVNPSMLIASRLLAGIGIGAELPLVDAYLSELLPARIRGRYTAWAYTLGYVGIPAAGLLGRFLVPRQPFGVDGWRWLFVAGSLGAVIVWFMRTSLPESPRWLESVGRIDEAEALVGRMEREAEKLGPLRMPNVNERPTVGRARLAVLFEERFRARTFMLGAFQVFQTVGYYGFGTLVPIVLASKGYSIVTSLSFVALTFVGYPIGSALSLLVIERIDRRWIIVGSALLMSILGVCLGYATSPGAIVTLGFLYTLASNFFSNGLHVFQVEIFPTFVRATASGACYGLSRLSSGAMPFVLLPVLRWWGAGPMFLVIAAALWIVMIDIALFAPSTTGRSLEEVNVS
jgi:putative MFS transporter